MRKQQYIIAAVLLAAITMLAGCDGKNSNNEEIIESDTITAPEICYRYGIIAADSFDICDHHVASGEIMTTMFRNHGVDARVAHTITQIPKKIFSPRDFKAGARYSTFKTKDSIQNLRYIVYYNSAIEHTIFTVENNRITATHFEHELISRDVVAEATIETSLWNAVVGNNLDMNLAGKLSDIYAWTIDFFGIQKGDGFKVYYKALYVDTTYVGVGDIYAARFVHNNREYRAYRFYKDTVHGYWDEDGKNLQKAFLKAPLKFNRISSKFSYSRKHPVYGIVRPHTGVDYAAPTGTPVRAIGDGRVVEKGYKGGGGNTVKIKHNSTYTSAYLHLSKYGEGVHVGANVRQGQVIGYVGSTGASTGPHLDFRIWKNGQPVNPLTIESPSIAPIPENCRQEFIAYRDSMDSILK